MLSKRQHALLVKGIEQLALENVMYHVEKDRHVFDYSAAIVNYHKALMENKTRQTKDYDHFIYNFDSLLAESIDLDLFKYSDIKAINVMKTISESICNRTVKGYVYKPNHLYEDNGHLKIDWTKFDLESHVKFLKESISHEAIQLCDYKLMNTGFWDGSHHVIKESKTNSRNKLLNEGASLGCDKKDLNYAARVFENVKEEVNEVLTSNGFIIENIYSAGSLRRKKSVVGDLDLLVNVVGHEKTGKINKHPLDEKRFLQQYNFLFANTLKRNIETEKIRSFKNIVQFVKEGMQCDVFMCSPTSIPTRRCYWTGSAAHNVKMLYEGFKKDIIYSFDYLYDKNRQKFLMPKNEKQIFSVLGVDYIEPELRK